MIQQKLHFQIEVFLSGVSYYCKTQTDASPFSENSTKLILNTLQLSIKTFKEKDNKKLMK